MKTLALFAAVRTPSPHDAGANDILDAGPPPP